MKPRLSLGSWIYLLFLLSIVLYVNIDPPMSVQQFQLSEIKDGMKGIRLGFPVVAVFVFDSENELAFILTPNWDEGVHSGLVDGHPFLRWLGVNVLCAVVFMFVGIFLLYVFRVITGKPGDPW